MRIRARHIVVIVIAAISLFIFYAVALRDTGAPPAGYAPGLAPPVDMPIENAPEIALETTHKNLGVIANDKIAEATVAVFNRGGSTLEVLDVHSSCPGCTVGYFEQGEHRIEPGASAQLKIKVSPEGVMGFHTQKTLMLRCNDPRNPQVALTVEAHIDPEFEAVPEHFDFGETAKGTAAKSVVLFRNRSDTPIQIREVTLSVESGKRDEAPLIAFAVAPIPETERQQPGREEYRITATLSPEMRGGEFEIPVFIHTDLQRFSRHQMPARGTIIAPYTVELDQETSDLRLRGNESSKITVRGKLPIAVTDIRSERGFLELQQRCEAPEALHIRCAPAASLERGIHKDSVLFNVELDGVVYSERIPVTIYHYGDPSGNH